MAASPAFKKDLGEGGFEALEARSAESGREAFAAKFGAKKAEAEEAQNRFVEESKGLGRHIVDFFKRIRKEVWPDVGNVNIIAENVKRSEAALAEFEKQGEALVADFPNADGKGGLKNVGDAVQAEVDVDWEAFVAHQAQLAADKAPATKKANTPTNIEAKIDQTAADAELAERLKNTQSGKMVKQFTEYRARIGETDAYGTITEVRLPETPRGELFIGYADGSSIRKFPTGLVMRVPPIGTGKDVEVIEEPGQKKESGPAAAKKVDSGGTVKEVTTAIAELDAAKKPGELRSFLAKGNYVTAAELALQSDADLEELRVELDGKLREMEKERREPYLQKARHQAELYLQHFDPNFTVGITNVEVKPDDPGKKPYNTRCLRISNLADVGMNWTMEIEPTDEYLKNGLEQALKKSYEEGIERSAAAEKAKEEAVDLTSDMKKTTVDWKGMTQRAEIQLVELKAARDTEAIAAFLENNGFATAEALAKMTRSDLERAREQAYEAITTQGGIPVRPYDEMFPPLREKKSAAPAGSGDVEAGSRRVVTGDTARAELLRQALADADVARAKTLPSGGQESEKATSSKKDQGGGRYDRMTLSVLEEDFNRKKANPRPGDSEALVQMEESIERRNTPEGLKQEIAGMEAVIARDEARLAALKTPEGKNEAFDRFAEEEAHAHGADPAALRQAWESSNLDIQTAFEFSKFHQNELESVERQIEQWKSYKKTYEGRLASFVSQPSQEATQEPEIFDPKSNTLDPAAMPAIVEALKTSGTKGDGKFGTAAKFKEALAEQGFKLPVDIESDDIIALHKAYKEAAHGKGKKKR